MRRLLTVLAVVTSSACAGGNPPADTHRAPAAPATPVPVLVTPVPPTPAVAAPPVTPRAVATVAGTVTYRLRIALTPEAVVQVELRDVSRQDAEAPLIGKQVITKPGQVPVAFSVGYDPAAILPGHVYAVSARIQDRGQLAFVTETPVTVFVAGAVAAPEIVVGPVR